MNDERHNVFSIDGLEIVYVQKGGATYALDMSALNPGEYRDKIKYWREPVTRSIVARTGSNHDAPYPALACSCDWRSARLSQPEQADPMWLAHLAERHPHHPDLGGVS